VLTTLSRRALMVRRSLAAAFALALTTLGAAPAEAHDNWIEVEPFFSSAAGEAKVYLFTGEQFHEAEPIAVRRRDRYSKFEVLRAGGRRDATADLREDQQPLAALKVSGKKAGTFVLALDAAPKDIEIAAEKFQGYLLEERLIDALMWRAGTGKEDSPGRERYSRSMKAILQVGPKLDVVATQPTGQDIEIVPMVHPYSLSAGSTLEVQVLFHGKPLAGRAITAANRYKSDISKKTARTDVNGKASFVIPRSGDWMFRLVHMEPASGDVDFRSYWANLTFSLPDAPPRP
jgi:uncharacterized GH25 family protein